ncbi:hypothetical protein CO154_00610 [Candidatus Pacearchaeota archaeon CG_4_9_14_3_um_filter_31_7]|nr:MAG: hypothetical protein AUJ10_03380 [Candidatus Pacearchaeota archaeon CG1_02_31_27]PIN92449.1 MAG: hypothetical protein COU55_01445 [Candidatus Pacearchaeota archaeon CG10_big_fil_rev_8_21_14_0_10_31_59]PIZ81034.1 MAG: hypothetical protein COX99_01145 [Candidatus Pacearchaeota archaeon CG_4_10_14_0_2_um_filter_31_10]PJA70867.1 MAG: hypothetical protein CO154_00610 [Candidatus Pacearchaeota archaeon CG_4_9_14_3_um_filter_31_7]
MEIEDLFRSWIFDIISSIIGIALISYSFAIIKENPFWWVALIPGILFLIPTIYFKIWFYIKE